MTLRDDEVALLTALQGRLMDAQAVAVAAQSEDDKQLRVDVLNASLERAVEAVKSRGFDGRQVVPNAREA
jgi:hypothetical protein